MKQLLQPAKLELPYRDHLVVDMIVGKRKTGGAEDAGTIDWSECPLAKRYPTWEVFHQQLAEERVAAKKANREAHPAAAPPKSTPGFKDDPDPEHLMSRTQLNKRYETTDRGR